LILHNLVLKKIHSLSFEENYTFVGLNPNFLNQRGDQKNNLNLSLQNLKFRAFEMRILFFFSLNRENDVSQGSLLMSAEPQKVIDKQQTKINILKRSLK